MKGSVAEVFGQKIRLLPQHVPQEHLTSVVSMGVNAFSGCSGLMEIHYDGTIKEWKAIVKVISWNFTTGNFTVYCTDGNLSKDEA